LDHPPQPPPQDQEASANPSSSQADPLRRLLDETADLIDSPTATHINTLLLDALFSQLTDHAIRTQAYKAPLSPLANEQLQDPTDRIQETLEDSTDREDASKSPAMLKAKFASTLAVITRQAHSIGSGVPNEYVQAMEGVRELEAFAAVIFSSHSGVRQAAQGGVAVPADIATEPEGAEAAEAQKAVAEERDGAGDGLGDSWGIWDSIWGKVTGAREGDGLPG
jgi:peroxin-3